MHQCTRLTCLKKDRRETCSAPAKVARVIGGGRERGDIVLVASQGETRNRVRLRLHNVLTVYTERARYEPGQALGVVVAAQGALGAFAYYVRKDSFHGPVPGSEALEFESILLLACATVPLVGGIRPATGSVRIVHRRLLFCDCPRKAVDFNVEPLNDFIVHLCTFLKRTNPRKSEAAWDSTMSLRTFLSRFIVYH